mgnify:CR=1 FL=1
MYIAILVVLIALCIYKVQPELGPKTQTLRMSKGTMKDSVATLLSRIQHGNKIPYSISYPYRYILIGIVLSFFMSLIWIGDITLDKVFIRSILVCFTFLLAFHNYFETHSDRFHSVYIDENVKFLRKKLKVKPVSELSSPVIKNHQKYFYYEL